MVHMVRLYENVCFIMWNNNLDNDFYRYIVYNINIACIVNSL